MLIYVAAQTVASGGIAGIVIGGVVVLVIILGLVVYRHARSALSAVATVKHANEPFWYTEELAVVRCEACMYASR